jgi:hypothetical protein
MPRPRIAIEDIRLSLSLCEDAPHPAWDHRRSLGELPDDGRRGTAAQQLKVNMTASRREHGVSTTNQTDIDGWTGNDSGKKCRLCSDILVRLLITWHTTPDRRLK